ncbi:hypothetical protein SEA_JAYCOOKIE_53 [Arthrobacter phage JayCookie]|uniref:Uncharacterized protein n=1 Tax=Arthrobacter phage JayCookie TaxID=2027885 RepID=A0A249XPZ7_9CAUD|nr:hypothetical protein SEA_JAYCOOKIE_53 [Arthrobacter phage JayCookie]
MTTTPAGMTNNQAALLAATTANANRIVSNSELVQATMGFKNLLDTLDQADADKAEDARIQAMPGYCLHHLKEKERDAYMYGSNSPHQVRRIINNGEQCNERECFQTDPTNHQPKKATEK